MKLLIINGPNINLLSVREPEIYGSENYKGLIKTVKSHLKQKGVKCRFFQSNCEGKIVDRIQNALYKFDGIIINPAAYTHTSIAIADALKAVSIPFVEVHISDINCREEFRKVSYIRDFAVSCVSGEGINGYTKAADILINYLSKE